MVEHVLRDNAPNDELADKVFALLNPSEGAMEYGDSGPTKEFAIARLKEALRLSAVVSAGICCQAEPFLR